MNLPRDLKHLFIAGKTIGHFATSHLDVPHVTPVWLDYDEVSGQILIDVESGTAKLRNVRTNPEVCISLIAADNSNHSAVIRGVITQIDSPGDNVAHVQTLAIRYLGRQKRNPGQRFVLSMKPTSVRWWGEER